MAKEKRPDHSKKFAVGTAVAGFLGIAGAAAYSPIYRRYYDAEVMHYSSAKAVYLFGLFIAASLLETDDEADGQRERPVECLFPLVG